MSAARLCIRYVIQLGAVALPKTADPRHMADNADADFIISDDDMDALKHMEHIADYGDFNVFPVFSGKPWHESSGPSKDSPAPAQHKSTASPQRSGAFMSLHGSYPLRPGAVSYDRSRCRIVSDHDQAITLAFQGRRAVQYRTARVSHISRLIEHLVGCQVADAHHSRASCPVGIRRNPGAGTRQVKERHGEQAVAAAAPDMASRIIKGG